MTIRNLQSFTDGIVDWGPLDQCFGDGISVGDVDGLVERNRRFLLLEAKRPGVIVKEGQARTHRALVWQGSFWVVTIWCDGNLDNLNRFNVLRPDGNHRFHGTTASLHGLQKCCAAWFAWADKGMLQLPELLRDVA